MNKFFKRLALLLAVLMIVSMMPVQLFADNSVITYVNNGTENGEDGTTTTEVASYVTVELEFGSNVSAEDIAAAKALYEGKKFDTCKAANEAYMALFGVTWGKGYLDVTDNSAPLYKYAGVSGSVAEVKYYIHGTLAGFTSLQSNYNNIDCTVGGNHQIARTSISIIGVNDENGGKAKLTDGNIQAYVAGGYISSFTASGKLTIDNIEFTSTTSTTVGASAAKDANSTQEVTSAEMEIKNCKFNGRLYVYDNFDNAGVMTYYIHDNVFDGANYNGDSNAYAIFAQCKGGNKLIIADNKISGFARGINIDHANVNATISGNTISIKDAGRSCIQLSSLTSTVISNNTLELTGGNAITLHEKLLTLTAAPNVTVEGNTITGNGYLIYDDAAANNKEFTSKNLTLTIGTNKVASTVYTTQGVKGSNKYGISETVATVVKEALTTVATVNGVGYATLADAIAAATPDANGVITYEISGKAEISGADQWISFVKNAEGVIAVKFVGMTEDAEISITSSGSILGVKDVDVDVSFENLTLSHPNGIWVNDLANATNYFACMVRRDGHTVTYTNCTFPNGACNNQYGKTVFNDCKFTSTTGWSLWNTSTGTSELNNCSFTGKRGIKLYAEGPTSAAGSVTVKDTTFVLNDSEKAAIEITKPGSVALDNISVSGTTAGTIKKNLTDGYKSVEKVTVTATGTGISGTFDGTTESGVAKEEFNISGGTFTSEVSSDYLADGFELKKNIDGTYGVKTAGAVEVWTGFSGPKVASYDTIEEAVANLGKNKWIVITKDYTLTEDFVIPTGVYLDIENGATLTVADGVTLKVAADCKRLGVRTGATLINNGTVLVCGTSPHDGGKVVAFAGSTVDIDKLTVPTGYFLDNNAASYFASIAIFEITYSDGSTKPASANTSWKNAVKVTLLTDVADFGGNNSVVAKNFVLDLGGFTLSGKTTASSEVLSISVPMTITNGTIKYVSSNTGSGALKTTADVTIDSTATINGGVGYAIWTDGYDGHTLTVNGTVKSDGSYAITSNGSENGGIIADCNIIVKDSAKIEAPNGIGIYHPELGTVTVYGGEITAHTGIEMCAGKLVVEGGKITSTGNNWDATGSQNAILDGAAVSIINRNYPGGIPTAEISGGEFVATGDGAQTIKAYDYKNNTVAEWTNVSESVSVSGGTFSSIPANMDKLCAEGFIPTKNADGTWGIKVKPVATVGGVEYATLAEAIAALNSTNHTLTLIDPSAWDAATPVYWQAGKQSGYAAKLTDALTAAYKANAGDITIVCRPGADVGAMTHGHVADNLTVYGNNAYISGGECDLEVDTCMYNRETGKQVATDGVYLDKDITITAYELDNLGVWGQRHTGFTINISLNDCDGKAIEGKANVQRVYISVRTGVNNITVVGCDFLTKATALYSNADGKITIDNCSFAGSQVPVNFNHKANGTQTVTVKNSTFTNCGDNDEWKQFAAPVRFVNSGSGTLTAAVDNCTFTGTVGANGDILLGDGRNGEVSFNVSVTVVNTAAAVQIHQPGYYGADGSTTNANCEKTTVKKSDTPTTFFTVAVAEVTFTDGTTKKYSDIAEALEAANAGDTVTLLDDVTADVVINKNITLDLGGKTLTNTGAGKATISVTGGTVTVKNGTVIGGTSYYNIEVTKGSNANLTLEDITATAGNTGSSMIDNWGTMTIKSGTYTGGLNVVKSEEGSTLTINGGKFTLEYATSGYTGVIFAYGTTTITGGEFIQNLTTTGRRNHPQVILAGVVEGYTSSVIVTGGKFTNKMSGESIFRGVGKATSDNFEVSGGTFNKSISDGFCADGFIPTKNAHG